jgi:adenylyltransferase/sulfurtransferase
VLIPLGQIEEMKPQNLHGLSQSDVIILHCKAGLRSLKAAKALKKIGFKNVRSMVGGIEEWSKKIDSSVPRY